MAGLFDDLTITHPLIDGIPPEMARAYQMSNLQSMLANLGAGLTTQRGFGPALGTAAQNFAAAQGPMQDRMLRQLILGNQMKDAREKKTALSTLASSGAPAGFTPEQWAAYIKIDPAGAMKVAADERTRARVAAAYSGGGDFGGETPSGPAPSPTGGVYDVPPTFAPQIDAAATRYGVPKQLLASTIWNESRWNPAAVNKNDQGPGIHSIGLGQWGEQWAKARGFDPRDPNASIDHTAQAMSEYARRYGGNWMLARLAYGWGPGNVDNWLKAGGNPEAVPDGAKIWLPRTAFGLAGEQEARAAWPRVAGMLRPGPVQMPWGAPQSAPDAQSPVQPVQYPSPGQGAPQAPPAAPTGLPDYRSDPEWQQAARARRAALALGDQKGIMEADQRMAGRITALRKEQEQRLKDERDYKLRAANEPVTVGPSGQPQVNPVSQEAAVARQAAQGREAAEIQAQSAVGKEYGQLRAKQFAELREKAVAADREINAIFTGRQIVDSGVLSGLGANQRVSLGRAGELLGIPSDKAVNSQVFAAAMAERVFALVRNLGSGTGISEGDRKFANQAAAGEITLDEAAIRRLLDIGERTARGIIGRFNKEGEGFRKIKGMPDLDETSFAMPAPPAYADWAKANPLTPLQRSPAQQPAPVEPRRMRWDGKRMVPE